MGGRGTGIGVAIAAPRTQCFLADKTAVQQTRTARARTTRGAGQAKETVDKVECNFEQVEGVIPGCLVAGAPQKLAQRATVHAEHGYPLLNWLMAAWRRCWVVNIVTELVPSHSESDVHLIVV